MKTAGDWFEQDASSAPWLSFFLSCVPPVATHHAKRIVRLKTREGASFLKLADKPQLVAARQTLTDLLRPHQPAMLVPAPVALSVDFTWPWRAGTPKRVKAAYVRVPKTTKPDLDNLLKVLTDRLAALRFIPSEDGAVAEVHARKFWGATPGICITLYSLGDPR